MNYLFFMLNDPIGEDIDAFIASIQHPFFMVVMGLIFWFAIIWSVDMKKRAKEGIKFWADQHDEVVVAMIGGLLFLVWDDEIIQGYYDWKGVTGHPELKPYYYLIIAPAIDRVYWIIKKIRNGKDVE